MNNDFLKYQAQTSPYPLGMEVSHAIGSYIYDTNNKKYLDFVAGVSANTLGHQHPRVNNAIKNQLDKNYQPLELGYDKWTNKLYGNKEFLMNCVNYLLDNNGLINIRSKVVNLPILDKEKVYDNYTSAQMVSVGLPLLILAIFGLLFTFLRKRKYSK